MTREQFIAAGGTIDVIRRNPPETRFLATLTRDGVTVRGRGRTVDDAITVALRQCLT